MTEEVVDWIEETEKEIDKIKKWELKDRLSLLAKLTFMNSSIASSVTGWHTWLTNPLTIEYFTEEELKELEKAFEKIAIGFLELDVKYTKFLSLKKKEESIPKKKSEKQSYVT